MTTTGLTVPARCCGPDTSGNGGWVCGAVAERLGAGTPEPVEARLHLPPPLDVPLEVVVAGGRADGWPVGTGSDDALDGGGAPDNGDEPSATVTHDGAVVATARPGRFEADAPAPVSMAEAVAAAERYIGFVDHAFPHCLSCGPQREVGDGLRVFPGPLDPADLTRMAAPWHAGDLPADDRSDGGMSTPMVWAALDCPSGWPSIAAASRPMVLGRMVAQVLAPVPAGDLVVVGEELWSEGRKHAGAAALYDTDGTLLARAESLWIELR